MQNGEHLPPNSTMESLMMRLASFSNLPTSASLSPSTVSKAGFYYTGEGDTVVCYSCGLCLNHWESGLQPLMVHRRHSPQCQFVVSQNMTGNVSQSTPTRRESPQMQQSHNQQRRQRHVSKDNTVNQTPSSTHNNKNVDRFTSKHMKERINRSDPVLLEEMKYERHRLSSYVTWPTDTNIAPEALAQAGLFYLYRADRVKCPFCGGILCNWKPSENPMRKHRQLFPRCPFIRNPHTVGNVILGDEPSNEQSLDINHPVMDTYHGGDGFRPKYPRYEYGHDRLRSFQDLWPSNNHVIPFDLANAGFFYKDGDTTCCFVCGGCVSHWQQGDVPLTVHLRLFPQCRFVRTVTQMLSSTTAEVAGQNSMSRRHVDM